MNATHDPRLKSWVESANEASSDFPIQNLPYGVFRRSFGEPARAGIAIGDRILDVTACVNERLLEPSPASTACADATLNRLMALDTQALSELRSAVSGLLSDAGHLAALAAAASDRILVPMAGTTMSLPAEVGDYTDFYASVHHATNVGRMLRPDNPLLPNYKYVPIGYHGRASSLVSSGSSVKRPSGQTKPADSAEPIFGPSQMLDYESELGFFVGQGNPQGEAIPIDRASQSIFGFCLVNDWSARDIQIWENQPLGPFLSKSFATTVSPWIVTAEATEPYRVPAAARPEGDPPPLPYLRSRNDQERGGLNATLEVYIASAAMRDKGIPAERLSAAPFSLMYWTVAQLLTHHASNGCNLRTGDLLASGTVSGPSDDSRGCLLELTWRGSRPVTLSTGEQRRFLHDGDEIVMRGFLSADGRPRIGFGECRGTILPAGGA